MPLFRYFDVPLAAKATHRISYTDCARLVDFFNRQRPHCSVLSRATIRSKAQWCSRGRGHSSCRLQAAVDSQHRRAHAGDNRLPSLFTRHWLLSLPASATPSPSREPITQPSRPTKIDPCRLRTRIFFSSLLQLSLFPSSHNHSGRRRWAGLLHFSLLSSSRPSPVPTTFITFTLSQFPARSPDNAAFSPTFNPLTPLHLSFGLHSRKDHCHALAR